MIRICKLFIILTFCAIFSDCESCLSNIDAATCPDLYTDPRTEHTYVTEYSIYPTEQTPQGIKVDPTKQNIDLVKIDTLTQELEECLKVSIRRCGFTVKVPDDWKYYQCSDRELFPCKDPSFQYGCAKLDCPCGCTGVVQYPSVAVVTPNLSALKHELIHIVTHRNHEDPVFLCQ